MKNQRLLSCLLILLVSVSLFSCNSAKKQIARKWSMIDFKSASMDDAKIQIANRLKSLDDSIKSTTDTAKINKFKSEQAVGMMMDKSMDDQKASMKKGETIFDFMKDGKFAANLNGKVQKGNWDVDAPGKKLIIQVDGKPGKDTMNIATLSDNNLTLTLDSTSMMFTAAK